MKQRQKSALSVTLLDNRCIMDTKDSNANNRKAIRKLLIAMTICVLVFIVEVVGGVMAKSLALISDAMHMFSDIVGFLIALGAIWLTKRKNNDKHTYGFQRAEILGAIGSILLIYLLTGILIAEAIDRVKEPEPIDAPVMMITAGFGLVANVLMLFALGGHHHHPGHSHDHDHSHDEENISIEAPEGQKTHHENINIRAATLHVLGDLLFSVGVLISSIVIFFFPSFTIIDPLCTFFFSVIVLFSTVRILRDSISVLMEATPGHINMDNMRTDLLAIQGVSQLHCLHIWSLSHKTALTVHVVVEEEFDAKKMHTISLAVERVVYNKYGIDHATIQLHTVCYEEIHSRCCQDLVEI